MPPSGPATPPNRPGARTRPGTVGSRPAGAEAGLSEASWEMWWLVNRWALLPDREVARRRIAATATAPSGVGEAGEGALDDADRAREIAATRDVVPFLLRLLAPDARSRDDVVASALLALGRCAREPSASAALRERLQDRRASPLVRESAALAIGLLRRDGAAQRLSGVELDRLRSVLLDVLDDRTAPDRTRAFAALSIGVLGDQPFADAFTRDGRAVVHALWERLGDRSADVERTVALLTALGMQPSAGVPEGVREGLHAVVLGKRVRGRAWNDAERAHALGALGRLGGPGCDGLALRVLERRREDPCVRRAALVLLGARASLLDAHDRAAALSLVLRTCGKSRDAVTTGLGQIALGDLVRADFASEPDARPCALAAHALLLAEARDGPAPTRGFSAIALALSGRDLATASPESEARAAAIERALEDGFTDRGDPTVRSAYAVALGLLGSATPVRAMLAVVDDRNAPEALRGNAAVAVGQIGRRTPEALRSLRVLLADRRSEDLRRQAALALSLLGDPSAAPQLLRELRSGSSERLLAQVAVALGRLDDLTAVGPLLEIARDGRRTELTQALATVSLGLLVDPGARPSLLRLMQDSNYPSRSAALHEVFTIL